MTDEELDRLMRKILLDAVAEDEENCTDRIPFEPSLKYQHQIALMLRNPLRWEKNRSRSGWKKAGQMVAAVLFFISISFGSLMAISPTARATVLQWITEWYETYVSYRYTQETPVPETMPEYVITDLPEGYKENISGRVDWPGYVQRRYENANGEIILFDYSFMTNDTATNIETGGAAVIDVIVNGCEGVIFISENPGESDCTLSWIDAEKNLHFTIDADLDQEGILHMAESVKLFEMTN